MEDGEAAGEENMRTPTAVAAALLFGVGCLSGLISEAEAQQERPERRGVDEEKASRLQGGFPTPDAVADAYEQSDLNRAIMAYRFFYPTVSMAGLFHGFERAGLVDNKVFGVFEARPNHVLFTANSDTPYAQVPLDLRDGPITVELPEGPLAGVANDLNFRWVTDMGLPGPDAGKGGKHILLPPGYKGKVPAGCFPGQATTNRVMLIVRSLPVGGDVRSAIERLQTVKVRPLLPPPDWSPPKWVNLTEKHLDATPQAWEKTLRFWEVLHSVIDSEPPYEPYRNHYGDLAVLGMVKGQRFRPDARRKALLVKAAKMANDQMRVQSFADRRPDRVVWKDRRWEWVTLVPQNGFFDMPTYADVEAREIWFFQAFFESPAMFRRKAGSGSLYWFNARDRSGAYLDGARTYKLTVPQPMPARLFWSVTVYDPHTRSQIRTEQGRAALRSLFELKDHVGPIELYFGPKAPAGKEGQWVQTIPGKGWFVYLRLFGPGEAAFDGTWKPGDFEACAG
jgi:hypothetical protein